MTQNYYVIVIFTRITSNPDAVFCMHDHNFNFFYQQQLFVLEKMKTEQKQFQHSSHSNALNRGTILPRNLDFL